MQQDLEAGHDPALFVWDEKTQVIGIWFMAWDGVDWLCSAYIPEDGTPRLRYRFRYYADDKVFDSTDKKSAYAFLAPGASPEEMVELVNGVRELPAPYGPRLVDRSYLPYRGAAKEAMEWLQGQSFVSLLSSKDAES